MAGPYDDNNPNLSLIAGEGTVLDPPSSSSSGVGLNAVSSLLSVLSPLAGILFNVGSQLYTNKKNRDWQEQMSDKQNALNLAQWKRENEYNTPAAQMQRYIEAGLNPALIYGQPNTAASSPNMVAPFQTPNSVAPQVDPLTASQIRNIDADTALKEKSVAKSDEEIANLLKDRDIKDVTVDQIRTQAELNLQLGRYYSNYIPYLANLSSKTHEESVYFYTQNQLRSINSNLLNEAFKAGLTMSTVEVEYLENRLLSQIAVNKSLSNLYNEQANECKSRVKLNDQQWEYYNRCLDDYVAMVKSNRSILSHQDSLINFADDHKGLKFWSDLTMEAVKTLGNAASNVLGILTKKNGFNFNPLGSSNTMFNFN